MLRGGRGWREVRGVKGRERVVCVEIEDVREIGRHREGGEGTRRADG